ncbi:hypothetical protein FKR81_24375 [Lentzea tibetensis]|uniref:Uncharacterized protein n=1 Tax=Lentzea tibetensis TaxID=2591470 RepID=A0A563EPI3_9PSEU|nr:permease prefix domain 1-containing protein [Lentzea tibetensis]TWP49255.1 hypothetical protein FKR81_24375 [Lentzea tibetensis]
MIDRYVADLDGRLRGPRAAKDDLLTETRDSLVDAVEAHLESGLSSSAAERRAIEEFGPVGTIARAYQAELAVSAGTRTLVTIAVVLPLMHVMWELNRWFFIGAWDPHMDAPPAWYLWLAKVNDMTGIVAAGVAFAALLVGRYLCRGRTHSATMGKLASGLALCSVAAVMTGQVAIMAATWHVDVRMLLLSPPVTIASAISLVILIWLGVLARRCLSCATIVR